MAGAGPSSGGDDLLIVATIRKPHGVRGEVALALETDRPRSVFNRGRVLLLGDARGRPSGGSLTVERARQVPSGMLLKTVEFASRTPELEALRGRSLLIPATDADGNTYAISLGTNTLVLAYNKTMIEAAGVELPADPGPVGSGAGSTT